MKSAARAGAIIATLALLAGCGPKAPPAPRELAVKLAWNTDGVTLADGRGTFTTDLGYTIEADQFEVTAYSFEVIPCEQPPPQPPGAPQPKQSSLSFIGTAWAGHRIGHPPTLTSIPRVERPLRSTTLDLDRLKIPDVAYCAGHYLIGRLPETGIDPADTANVDVALRVHGRYRKGDAAWTAFTVETPVSHGTLADLPPEGRRKGIRVKSGDTIVVTRRLDTAFNGVDFATMEPPALARQILRDVVAGTTLTHQHGAGG